jgi:hypothetical protein
MLAERFIRRAMVVIVLLFLHFLPHLVKLPEDVGVWEFAPEAAV